MLQHSETELACCLASNAFLDFSIEILGSIKETGLIITADIRRKRERERERGGRLRLALRISIAFLHDLLLVYN